jgi:hypothetical protein
MGFISRYFTYIDSNGRLTTTSYGKRDVYYFATINFPYVVIYHFYMLMYISQIILYARVCFALEDFSKRSQLLTKVDVAGL